MNGVSHKTLVLAIAAALFVGVVVGYAGAKGRADRVAADAVAQAHKDNLTRNDEVVNGWAHAVDYLRARLRNGDAPRIPVSGTATAPGTAGRPDGRPADDVPAAGKLATLTADLATCRAERQRLIEDAAMTTIQLRELQAWAR